MVRENAGWRNPLWRLHVVVLRRLYSKGVEDGRCDLPGISLNRAGTCRREGGATEQREPFRPMIARPMHGLSSADNAESA